jgi:uncharacterized membrane protein YgdD (TMEM256/DUF423 family)
VDRTFFLAGALAGLVGVAFGAFGAHGLRGRLSPEMLAVFETGVRYQMYHALALMLTSALSTLSTRSTLSTISGRVVPGRAIAAAGWLFLAGIVLFSGSLYLLAVTGITVLGAITPIGGVAFLLGWACLAIAML